MDRPLLKVREVNEKAFKDLMLSCDNKVYFGILDAACTTNLPNGDAAKAWKGLFAKYKLSTELEKVKLDQVFAASKVETVIRRP